MPPKKAEPTSGTPSRAGKWLTAGAVGVGVVVTLESFSGSGDALLMADPPPSDSAAVLVTAKPVNGSCPTFRTGVLFQLTDRVSLEQNYTYGCAYSLTVFAPDNSVLVGNPENDWSDAVEEHTVGALVPALTVELQIWNATGNDSTFTTLVDADIGRANAEFHRQRAGIVLQRQAAIKVFTPLKPYAIEHDCDSVEVLLGFSIDPARVNVVYVDSFVDFTSQGPLASTASGYACTRHDTPPPLVFLSQQHKHDLTLAHEIGHILGHSIKEFPVSGGPPHDRVGFDSSNLMWNSAATSPDPRVRFSLGQIFRVHLDSRSWINRAQLRAGLQLKCKEENKAGALVDSTLQDGLEPCPRLITGEE